MLAISGLRFNALINGAAQQVTWRKAGKCPCRSSTSGQPVPGCPNCSGNGITWFDPTNAWCVASGQRIQREWAQNGLFESGDVIVTVGSDSPLYQAGEFDRVLLVQQTEPFESVLTYTGSETLGWPVMEVDQVFWLDPKSKAIVQGGIPGTGLLGQVCWNDPQGGPAPPPGIQYSITGRRVPEYFVFGQMPADRAHFRGATLLPRRVTLRKYDLFSRG